MRPVKAGRMRKRVVIEFNDNTTAEAITGDGQPEDNWREFATRWASVEPIETSGREFREAANVAEDVTHVLRLRYLPGVTAKHRVMFGIREFEIESVVNVEERGRETVLICREKGLP